MYIQQAQGLQPATATQQCWALTTAPALHLYAQEQREAAAAAAMPPPRSMGRSQPPHHPTAAEASTSGSSGFLAPPWAVPPPAGLVLQVLKEGVVIQEIPLQQVGR